MWKKEAFIEIVTVYNDRIKLYLSSVDKFLLQARGTFQKGAWKQVIQPKV